MSPFPWGLIAVGLVGVVLLARATWVRHRGAARAVDHDEPGAPAEQDEPIDAEDVDVIDLRDRAGSPVPEVIDLTDGHPVRAHGFSLVLAHPTPSNGGGPAGPTRSAPAVGTPGVAFGIGARAPGEVEVLETDLEAARARVVALLATVGERRAGRTDASDELAADLAVVREELRALGARQKRLAEARRRVGAAPVADVGPDSPHQEDILDQRMGEAVIRALRSWIAAAP